MAIERINIRKCCQCGQSLTLQNNLKTHNIFYQDGYLPICNNCLVNIIDARTLKGAPKWSLIDALCQYIDIPFIPERWEKMYKDQGIKAIIPYCKIFEEKEYERQSWVEQQTVYKELESADALTNETVPKFNEQQKHQLQVKWGFNYDDEELQYLEGLYNGVLQTQSVNGVLQTDQALKLCKLSLTIDSRIREGQDIDKPLSAYEKIVKIADFTPKNVKNAYDFDSVGEVFAYLEKTGFVNKFYDGTSRDVIDVTMKNIQQFNQRLYIQETGIGEEIDKRIEQLNRAKEIEDNMGLLDDYTSDEIISDIDNQFNEEFNLDI